MKIGFDAKRAFLNKSGLGNYSRTLFKSLNKYHPNNEYSLFTTKKSLSEFEKSLNEYKNVRIFEPQTFIDKKLSSRWRSYGITELLIQNKLDIYHGLSNELPINIHKFKGKKIVTTHDLIFLRYPKLYPFLDRKIYNLKFRQACEMADKIIAISEETKRDIQKYYLIPESKISVVYQSCDEAYYSEYSFEQKAEIKAKYQLPDQFLFYVGTIEERKNLMSIVKSLKKVKDISLYVVGKKTNYFYKVLQFLKENHLENRVLFIENISNEDLPIIYQLATIFLFPSIFEGFGIPIIEALISKTPVISSNGSCFPEAGGPDTLYIDPQNDEELAENIQYLLNSEYKRLQMAQKGFEYAQKFHPKVISEQIIQIYNQ